MYEQAGFRPTAHPLSCQSRKEDIYPVGDAPVADQALLSPGGQIPFQDVATKTLSVGTHLA